MIPPKRLDGAVKPMLAKLVLILIVVLVGSMVWRAVQRIRR